MYTGIQNRRKFKDTCRAVGNVASKSDAVGENKSDTSICCSDSEDNDFVLQERSKKRKFGCYEPDFIVL